MRPVQVVKSLPLLQLLFKIYVVLVRQQLVELLLVRPVGSLDLTVELRASWFDVNMPDPLVFNMPMELGLPFMTAVGAEGLDAERKFVDYIVRKVDGVFLGAPANQNAPPPICTSDASVKIC